MNSIITRIILTIAVLALPSILFAQQVPAPVEQARESVFRVGFTIKDKTGLIGTAWAVNDNTLITNAHVVNAFLEIEKAEGEKGTLIVFTEDGQKVPIIEYTALDKIDAATLRIASHNLKPLAILPGKFDKSTPIWIVGFPGVSDHFAVSTAETISGGTIHSYFDYNDPSSANIFRIFRHQATSGPGSSGSPILNKCGDVVGLHFAGESDDKGAGIPGASRLAISSQMLADYLAVESRSTKFETAGSCQTSNMEIPVWVYVAGAALLAVAGASYFVKSRSGLRNTTPTPNPASQPKIRNTLVLRGRRDDADFEVQAEFKSGKGSLQIGSSEDPSKRNDLVLSFPHISRVHAKIERIGDSLLITDVGSANGTTVKGRKIAPNEAITLSNGETVSFGDVEIEVILK